MANRSKEKGKRYERQVAEFLSKQFNTSFVRVPNSGAFVGGKNFTRRIQLTEGQTKTFKGDIIPPENWNIVIECKNYEKISGGLPAVIKGNSVQLNKWIKELRGDAGELEGRSQLDYHILFLKITRVGEWFIVPENISVVEDKIPYIQYWYEGNSYLILDICYFDKFKNIILKRSCSGQ